MKLQTKANPGPAVSRTHRGRLSLHIERAARHDLRGNQTKPGRTCGEQIAPRSLRSLKCRCRRYSAAVAGLLCKYSEIAKGHAESACPFLLCVQPPPCLPPRTASRAAFDSGCARGFHSVSASLPDSGCTRGSAVSRSRSAPYRSLKYRFALVLCRGGCGRRRPILRDSIQMRQGGEGKANP